MAVGERVRIAILHPLETVLCVLLVAIVALIFTQVVTRYLLHVSLSWSEESARYLLMWLAMLSAAYGFKVKAHFALVFIVNRLPERTREVVSLAVSVLVCALLFLFIVKAVGDHLVSEESDRPRHRTLEGDTVLVGNCRRSPHALLRGAQCVAGLACPKRKRRGAERQRTVRGASGGVARSSRCGS